MQMNRPSYQKWASNRLFYTSESDIDTSDIYGSDQQFPHKTLKSGSNARSEGTGVEDVTKSRQNSEDEINT